MAHRCLDYHLAALPVDARHEIYSLLWRISTPTIERILQNDPEILKTASENFRKFNEALIRLGRKPVFTDPEDLHRCAMEQIELTRLRPDEELYGMFGCTPEEYIQGGRKMDYPVIPREEYPSRWQKVQTILKEQDLDLILAYADDRATYGTAYGRYFADIPVHFENVLILFARDREPILLVGPETDGYAQLRSTIRDIRVLAEFSAEEEDYPFSTVIPLAEIIADMPAKKIGLAAKVHMSATLYEAILKALPDATFTNVDSFMHEIRGIKTPAEIEVIRYAYRIADLGMEAAIRAIRPGVTEREVAAEAEYAMRKAGCEGYGIDTMVASGVNTDHIIARTTMRKIEENDVVCVTLAPRYEGYHGACARTIVVGDPGEKFLKALDASIFAQRTCMENLNVGNIGCEVEKMGRDIMEKAGYGKNFMYSGLHSVGVTEFEPPILGPSSNTVIQNNMVISVDIPLYEADIHGFRTESGYLIQGGVAHSLSTVPYVIRK